MGGDAFGFGDKPAPQEPNATMRVAASQLRQMRDALLAEGFSRDEVMTLIAKVLEAGVTKGGGA